MKFVFVLFQQFVEQFNNKLFIIQLNTFKT